MAETAKRCKNCGQVNPVMVTPYCCGMSREHDLEEVALAITLGLRLSVGITLDSEQWHARCKANRM